MRGRQVPQLVGKRDGGWGEIETNADERSAMGAIGVMP